MSALEGASKYLNNLLLARGLLPNGKAIDFARSTCGENDTDTTTSKIINLVHDLVLRRDREAEHREGLAASINHLRTADTQHTLSMQQIENKNQQLRNELSTAQSQERTVQASMKKLERQVRELKDQNLKMKSMLDQVRAKCTSDVRKRDVEIEKLKGHLTGIQRGKKDSSGMKINTFNLQAAIVNRERRGEQNVNSTDWSLEQETNDFLAGLVNETSAENVALRRIVDDTIATLRDMSGIEDDPQSEEDNCIGIPGQYRRAKRDCVETLVPVDELVLQMNEILQHCRTILRDPSFVPIEEVQIREEEILKLRAGWERMADRWKEAVTMMGQWKQKMMLEGNKTDVEDLSDLSFGRSVAIRPDGQPVLAPSGELSMIYEESMIHDDSHDIELECVTEVESDLELEPQPAVKRLASSPAKRGVKLPRVVQPLGETNGNTGPRNNKPIQALSPNTASDIERDTPGTKSPLNRKKLTVTQKLAAVEAEAIEAERKRSCGAAEKRKIPSSQKLNRKSNRRRSTLSPEELANLMEV